MTAPARGTTLDRIADALERIAESLERRPVDAPSTPRVRKARPVPPMPALDELARKRVEKTLARNGIVPPKARG